ncbi:MAG: PAS domain-containing protein [Salinivirgaceae bacterium]|nr:PAS domain-containing protein [Salinivirgaceae bacterium]
MEVHLENNKLIIDDENSFLHEIINSIGALIHILKIDTNGNTLVVWMNKKYTEIMGYSFEERIKIGFADESKDFYHPDDIEVVRNGIKLVLQDRNHYHVINFRIKDKNNDWQWMLVSAQAITIQNDPNFLLVVALPGSDFNLDYNILLNRYYKEVQQLKNQLRLNKLTKAEKEVTALYVSGMTTKEIALKMNRSFHTTNNHKRNIFKKLNIHNMAELVAFAKDTGLV